MLKFALFTAVATILLAPASSHAQQKTAKPTVTPILCAVKGEVIPDVTKAAGTADYKGKTYFFCCPGCTTTFTKADDSGKAKFAKLTELRGQRFVLARAVAVVDAEIAATEKAGKSAKAVAKTVTVPVFCAVTGEEIASADQAAATLSFNNKTYYLCCPGCQVKWNKDPAKYAAAADKRAAAK